MSEDIVAWLGSEGICGWLIEINNSIKELNLTIKAFLAKQEALQPHLEYTRVEEKLPRVEEQVLQDLNGITILKKTAKSYIVFKNGYTCAVAFSHLKSGDGIVVGFQGNLNDDIFEERKWILKSNKNGEPNLKWKPFQKEE